MIFGANNNFGANALLGYATQVPRLNGFTSVTFGDSDTATSMKIGCVWGQELIRSGDGWVDMTTEYLDNYNPSIAGWTQYTYLLADFNNDLEAGAIRGLGDIEGWVLYRWDSKTNQAVLLGEFDADVIQYIDYTALLNTNYTYLLYAHGQSSDSSALQSPTITPNYYGYFLIDVTNDVVYKFDTNLSGGDLQQNTEHSSFKTNNKYQTYNIGDLQYLSGNINALVRYANSNIYINNTVELLENLRNCIKDGERIKILKTRKGEGWYVFTYDYSDSVVNQAIGEQPVNASFSFDVIGTFEEGINNSSLQTVY